MLRVTLARDFRAMAQRQEFNFLGHVVVDDVQPVLVGKHEGCACYQNQEKAHVHSISCRKSSLILAGACVGTCGGALASYA
jgi:hypothetical protein